MNVSTNRIFTIFKQENQYGTFYSIGLSHKKQDGSYENGYMPVRFKKGVELNNQTRIEIKNAWIDFYKDKNKATQTYIFINEFETTEQIATKNTQEEINEDDFNNVVLTDDDLPF